MVMLAFAITAATPNNTVIDLFSAFGGARPKEGKMSNKTNTVNDKQDTKKSK